MNASADRVQFTLDFIEILDSMDLDTYGEFRFEFRVSSDRRGLLRNSRLPEKGTLSLSEHAAKNRLSDLNHLLWEGVVEPGEVITVEGLGTEADRLSRNEGLDIYRRAFQGDPAAWTGDYGPWDEASKEVQDPENLNRWRLSYTVRMVSVARGSEDPRKDPAPQGSADLRPPQVV